MARKGPFLVVLAAGLAALAAYSFVRRSDSPAKRPLMVREREPRTRSLEEVRNRLAELKAGDWRARGTKFKEYLLTLSAQELRGLLTRLDSSEFGSLSDGLGDTLLTRLAEIDPLGAVRLAEQFADPELRSSTLRLVAEHWLQEDTLSAVQWLVSSEHRELQVCLAPAVVAQMAASHAQADHLWGPLLAAWASSNFNAALGWVQGLAEGPVKERALLGLAYQWVERNPLQALAYAHAGASGNAQLLTTLACQWAKVDPYAASRWAAQLPEGPERTRTIPSLAAAWAQQAPTDAARFAVSLPPGQVQEEAIVSVISGWAHQDPRSAVQWASEFPAGQMRDQAFTQVLSAWTQRDAASAAEYLSAMPENPGRDAAINCFSGSITERYPAIALVFAQIISNESVRNERIEKVARRWLATDPGGASIAIANSDLPPAIVARLLPER